MSAPLLKRVLLRGESRKDFENKIWSFYDYL